MVLVEVFKLADIDCHRLPGRQIVLPDGAFVLISVLGTAGTVQNSRHNVGVLVSFEFQMLVSDQSERVHQIVHILDFSRYYICSITPCGPCDFQWRDPFRKRHQNQRKSQEDANPPLETSTHKKTPLF